MSWMKRGRSYNRDAYSVLRGFKKVIITRKMYSRYQTEGDGDENFTRTTICSRRNRPLPLTILIFSG